MWCSAATTSTSQSEGSLPAEDVERAKHPVDSRESATYRSTLSCGGESPVPQANEMIGMETICVG